MLIKQATLSFLLFILFIQANELVLFIYLCVFYFAEIAQVIAPYTATGLEQLTLAPGQLILIRKKNPGGWWEGELQVWKEDLFIHSSMCAHISVSVSPSSYRHLFSVGFHMAPCCSSSL